ncbi:MAG: major outer membrane protein FomA, partial [Fusobacteriaceae bacterium]
MKKLALLLAAMTAVSAVASAKEVVAAPVVAVEPVALVCPEPVVEWRPTGYIDFAAKYYGE